MQRNNFLLSPIRCKLSVMRYILCAIPYALYTLISFLIIFNLTGCSTVPIAQMQKPQSISGTYHRVKKGETLWKISKINNVELDELTKANNLSENSTIEIGQLILVPDYLKKQIKDNKLSSEEFTWPLKGIVISRFGQTVNNAINKGINIEPGYSQNVLASRSGKVIFYSPNFAGLGKTIIIDHRDGYSSVYARNSEVFVKIGDNIEKGALIAKAGRAGKDKNTYLHFEIRKGHLSQNPNFYLP